MRSAVPDRSLELTPGVTIDDTIQLAKEIDGYIDLLQIRGTFIDPSQPTYLNPKRIPHLETTAAIKEGCRSLGVGTKITLMAGARTRSSWTRSLPRDRPT